MKHNPRIEIHEEYSTRGEWLDGNAYLTIVVRHILSEAKTKIRVKFALVPSNNLVEGHAWIASPSKYSVENDVSRQKTATESRNETVAISLVKLS